MKAYDLTNQRFGRLIALYKCNYKLNNHYPWFCQCDCGNTKVVRTADLISGKTQSCGCLQKEIASNIGKRTGPINGKNRFPKKDITNQQFGRLIALEPIDTNKHAVVVWKCQCQCGNTMLVPLTDLVSGNTQSCGCLRSKGQEKINQLLTQYNISFVTEKSFMDCVDSQTGYEYRFDFFVNDQYLIEYDGIQHFQETHYFKVPLLEQQRKDREKNDWYKKHNILLIRIPYLQLSQLTIQDLLVETSEFVIK